ncbi:bifunctional molybdenum cofactor guanylyltransferase MobA/molybdopterin-guanine dinucleotide biosynthesis adaptor protein MobB [Salinispira pacifica]
MTDRHKIDHSRTAENSRAGHHGHQDRKGPDYRYSPFEIAFAGYSGAGKTGIITRIIETLAPSYAVGYVKHDAHGFDMDRPGKDTFRVTEAGAGPVYISDRNRWAALGASPTDEEAVRALFVDSDMVLVEGHRHSELPKILVVDRRGEILSELENGEITNVVAAVVPPAQQGIAERVLALCAASTGEPTAGAEAVPLFRPGDTEAMRDFILSRFRAQAGSRTLHGLVLSGGKSSRMGRDKGAIEYHDEPQVRYVHRLLERFCDKVYVSVRSEQTDDPAYRDLPHLADRFVDFGPMGGILTALHTHPEAAWLVLGCDMPFVTEQTIANLLSKREPLKLATVFDSSSDGLPEPLCAVYEPAYRRRLHQFLGEGRTCPRKALIRSRVQRLALSDPGALRNINSPEEYDQAAAEIAGRTAGPGAHPVEASGERHH